MGDTEAVMRRALAGGRWRAPDMRELRARGYGTGAEPAVYAFGLAGFMAGEPRVHFVGVDTSAGGKLEVICSSTPASELADPAGGWEPIGGDVAPVEPPPAGTKRWLEALALRCTGVAATASHARPGVVLIELAGEPRLGSVDLFLGEATLGRRVSVEVTWTKTVDGPAMW